MRRVTFTLHQFKSGMTPRSFEEAVRERVAYPHLVGFNKVAVDSMRQRGITRTMVLHVLRRGSVERNHVKQERISGNWSAPLVGIAAGMEIRVTCAIDLDDLFVIAITANGGR